jgi:hypothetical protein
LPLATIVLPLPFVVILIIIAIQFLFITPIIVAITEFQGIYIAPLTFVIIICCHLRLLLVLSIRTPLMLLFCVAIQIKIDIVHSTFDES